MLNQLSADLTIAPAVTPVAIKEVVDTIAVPPAIPAPPEAILPPPRAANPTDLAGATLSVPPARTKQLLELLLQL